jgi:hypothetical protein
MPQRRIPILGPIELVDPDTGQPAQGPQAVLDFKGFLQKLFANPLWNESWKHGLAQQSISNALQMAMAKNEPCFVIADEDWEFLNAAAKHPRTTAFVVGAGLQVISGLGYHPSVAGQIVPMQLAVINAETI